ncbi:solute carrier family 25 member 24, like [Polypterus senegalus]|uniref:solute carrier family 25 member 24, like n=1 Tax=Polypterus senegalus TaxID=55291 RepID=UPI00196355EA|nr:solute carrier family 25 member 24, like [Polypterus senegalus]
MDQFRNLFQKLDTDNDGFISLDELHKAMENIGVEAADEKAKVTLSAYDRSNDSQLDYEEFLSYIKDSEKKWKINFKLIDKNDSGFIDQEDIMNLFKDVGLHISKANAADIIKKMDADGSMTVDWDEFLHHVVLSTSNNIEELVSFWRQTMVFDVGESLSMPMQFSQKEIDSGVATQLIIIGGIADVVSRTVTAPIDRLKTQLQVDVSRGVLYRLQQMRAGGLKSLWHGNAASVMKGTPQSVLQYLIYNKVKHFGHVTDDQMSISHRFALGCVSGAAAHTVFFPVEVLKVRLNLQESGTYTGLTGCIKSVYKNESWRSFYRGFKPSIMCMVPYAGMECAINETLVSWAKRRHSKPSFSMQFFYSFASFACGQIACYPLALTRTQLQAQASQQENKMTSSISQILKNIYIQHGIKGLYSGMGASFVRAFPCACLKHIISSNLVILFHLNV